MRLDVDMLSVDSFETAEREDARGTVRAHEDVITPRCVVTSGINSCWCTEYNTCNCV